MTTKGFLRGLGSQVWAIPEDVHNRRFFLITAGTRFMSVYRAHEKESAHPTGPDGTIAPQLQARMSHTVTPIRTFHVWPIVWACFSVPAASLWVVCLDENRRRRSTMAAGQWCSSMSALLEMCWSGSGTSVILSTTCRPALPTSKRWALCPVSRQCGRTFARTCQRIKGRASRWTSCTRIPNLAQLHRPCCSYAYAGAFFASRFHGHRRIA